MSSSPRVKSLVLGVLAIWLLSQACSLIPKRVTQPNIYQEPEVEIQHHPLCRFRRRFAG